MRPTDYAGPTGQVESRIRASANTKQEAEASVDVKQEVKQSGSLLHFWLLVATYNSNTHYLHHMSVLKVASWPHNHHINSRVSQNVHAKSLLLMLRIPSKHIRGFITAQQNDIFAILAVLKAITCSLLIKIIIHHLAIL